MTNEKHADQRSAHTKHSSLLRLRTNYTFLLSPRAFHLRVKAMATHEPKKSEVGVLDVPRVGTGTCEDLPLAPEVLDEQYETTKKEIYAYYAYVGTESAARSPP